MKEQLISFETAKLAKQKGFNIKIYKDAINYELNPPTQSLLQKWLREEHNIHVIMERFLDMYVVFIYRYNKIIPIYEEDSLKKFTRYEDTLEAGLKEGLKLIKTN